MDHQCEFRKLETPICTFHSISCIYHCDECDTYHVCDGGVECIPIDTGENMVCVLTGKCIDDNMAASVTVVDGVFKRLDEHCEKHVYENIILSLKLDIIKFFSSVQNMEDVQKVIFKSNGELTSDIETLISSTFHFCARLFDDVTWAYDLVCSMYIHIIISVYSSRTVYGNLLFKCTKNKRYDTILKQMREAWMSTLTTDGCSPDAKTTLQYQ